MDPEQEATELMRLPRSDLEALTPAEAEERARQLVGVVHTAYIELMETLYIVRERKLYEPLGFTSFDDWVQTRLNFGDRKSKFFVAIYRALVLDGELTKEEIGDIGWTKLRALQQAYTDGRVQKEELKGYLEQARTANRDDFEQHMKSLPKAGEPGSGEGSANPNTLDGPRVPLKNIVVAVEEDVYASWIKVNELIKRRAGNSDLPQSQVFEALCLEALVSVTHDMSEPIEFYMSVLERTFPGYEITATKKGKPSSSMAPPEPAEVPNGDVPF